MSEGAALETWAAVRAALMAAPAVTALVGARVVDEPGAEIALPYLRAGRLEPRPDDTDGATGEIVALALEVHSRDDGATEAHRILAAVKAALHRRPEALTVAGFAVIEARVLAQNVERARDGATYAGTLALEVWLDSAA